MKKFMSLMLATLLATLFFAGCGADETSEKTNSTSSEKTTASDTETSSKEESSSSKKKNSSSSKQKPSSSKKKQTSKVKKPTSSREETVEEITYTEEEKIYYGLDPEIYKVGLKNKGDSSRIAALMKKAKKGGKYKIAVLGGSISRGAGASSVYSSYGNLVCEWWIANFPNASFEFVNAGFGSTNPEMACYRMGEDLLKYNPDFVVVDFTVNTYLDNDVYNTYSTILYKILSQKNTPAVMAIDFTNCDRQKYELGGVVQKVGSGSNPEITNATKEYNIPTMSYHNYIWEKLDSEVIKWRDIGSDYIHPNDNGHMVAANLITAHLDEVLKNLNKYSGKITAPQKPEASDYSNLEYIINTANGVKMSGGFTKRINDYADGKGWSYTVDGKASALTIPIPQNKSIKVFIKIDSGSDGSITVTDSNNTTRRIYYNDAGTPTLVDIGKMSGEITFTPNMTKGGFTIYGIGVRK